MDKIRREQLKLETISVPKFNIRDTKRFYSDLNNLALKGIEVITYNAINEDEQVSHLKTSHLDKLLDMLTFSPVVEKDEELQVYTIGLSEIDLYGEGKILEDATEDLLNSIIDFLSIYIEKLDIFSKVESDLKQLYLLKLFRCQGDKEKIRKVIGL